MTTITLPVLVLAVLLALAAGCIIGNRTRRFTPPAPGYPCQDTAALALGSACCETWWTSCGTHHDTTCPTPPRSTT